MTGMDSSAPRLPSVAAVVPAHNAETWLEPCLDGLASQTHRLESIVVVDDGSADGTLACLERWQGRHPGCPILICRHETPQGPSAARNTGWRATAADWIAFCDADDVWHPDHLRLLLHAASAPGVNLVCSQVHPFERILTFPPVPEVPSTHAIPDPVLALFRDNFIPQSAAMIRRDLLTRAGGYDPQLRLSEDYDLWSRVALDAQIVRVEAATVGRRLHSAQASRVHESALYASAARIRARLHQSGSSAPPAAWRSVEGGLAEQLLDEAWRSRNAERWRASRSEVRHWPGAAVTRQAWERRAIAYWPFRLLQAVYDRLPEWVRRWRRSR